MFSVFFAPVLLSSHHPKLSHSCQLPHRVFQAQKDRIDFGQQPSSSSQYKDHLNPSVLGRNCVMMAKLLSHPQS